MNGHFAEYYANHYEHVHDHTGITSCNDGHCHLHPGVTGTPIYEGRNHYHPLKGATTYVDGHFHIYDTNTSYAIPLPDGYHTHHVSFTTSYDDGHRHQVMGYVMATRDRAAKDYE